jgi:curved DNA-binding protein CbpA
MEYSKALDLLGIPRKHICLDKEMVRKAYLKASLKYHPDKYGDNGEKFKEINKAYIFLCENNKFYHNDTENNFDNILEELIQKFSQKTNWNSVFIKTTIKGIFTNHNDYIIQLFDNLEKNIAIEVFDCLIQLQFFTNWDEEYIKKIKNIIHKKMKHDNIVLLNPTIDDLMSDQIYKLNVGNNEFYIPLWHNELYFDLTDSSGNKIDLIVKIKPDIFENVTIDYENNIIIKWSCDVKELLNSGEVVVKVGKRVFNIKSEDIKCTKNKQCFYFKKKGILKMNNKNIFDSSERSDVNIELELI